MFEGLEALGAAWRTVAHLSEWSGLSLGALAGCGALVYFDPAARKLAIGVGVVVVVGWACLVHGHSAGVADEDARLKIVADRADAHAGDVAKQDEISRVAIIEAEARAQHASDLAEIERLKAGGSGCAFDPDDGMRAQSDAGAGAVRRNPKPAGVAKAPDKSAAAPAPGFGLSLPLVWRRWLQGQGHSGDASPDGK